MTLKVLVVLFLWYGGHTFEYVAGVAKGKSEAAGLKDALRLDKEAFVGRLLALVLGGAAMVLAMGWQVGP